ncbi:Chaperone of endosialidase [Peptostreptococcus russellii]|uniref:Chaperone of endosialidase n=1 Tax=Peptostreptococcus russellii TaxID=215200 RepID=A0A1H8JYF0_9FIRM|nr:tail fiber domain-containing protein [Peptostreptococcus russellii]SEN85545.1 Chaperone of endosialidase [Peptostreptococcus russellii]
MDMKLIKEAFSNPSRELSAKVTIDGKEFTDEYLKNIKVVTGLSEGKDFSVGTAFMSSATIKLVDKYENFNESNFKDKTAVVEIGVKTNKGIGYAKLGEFIIDSANSNMRSWELKSYDLMSKFNVKYDSKLNFPCKLKDIVLDICKICGVPASDSIKNSSELNRNIKFKPNFYDMTAREVLAQVSELVCGWAYIDAISQKLEIGSYSNADDIKINDDNIILFKEFKNRSNADSKIQIDSIRVIQNGADDADYNKDSDKKFHIVDNMFIQGNGIDFIDVGKKSFKFNELSALSIKYNGNPTLGVGKAVTVFRGGKLFKFLPLVRKLTYNGGLVEECECPQINYNPSNRKKDIVRHIEKINSLLRVMDDKIQAKVGTEEFSTLVEQTKEEIKALAKSIDLKGYVKFEDLKGENDSTEINGGLIKSGLITSKDKRVGIDLDNGTILFGKDLEHYSLLFDGETLKFGLGTLKTENFSTGLLEELKGEDGKSQYVHIKYSDSGGDVGAMYIDPDGHDYIGIAVTDKKTPPAYKTEFKWSKYTGVDGKNGSPGQAGKDGKTPYFHIAYANSSDGRSGFSVDDAKDKLYMGTYVDYVKEDSTNSRDYTWALIKGDKGERGLQGPPGKDGRPGRDGSLVDLPPALKVWNNNATRINGKYIYTPELFVGSSLGSDNKTGVYIGSNIQVYEGDWGWHTFSGIVGMKKGVMTWRADADGNLIIGNKAGKTISIGSNGNAIIPKITSSDIETKAITTDLLYPGNNNRIVLERGYSPGSNNCKSIDANGSAIRLKVDADTYISMRDSGIVEMYSRNGQFFKFDPRESWYYNGHEGDGWLVLHDAHVSMGWLEYSVYSTRSDRRLKENIKYIKNKQKGLNRENIFDFIKTVDLATYRYKKTGGNNISMIAQDVEEFKFIKDYLVGKNKDGIRLINTGNYTSMMHIALQEEIKKREVLEDKVKSQEARIKRLEKLLLNGGEKNA